MFEAALAHAAAGDERGGVRILSTSRVLKPSNTPGRTRMSGALMRVRRRAAGVCLGTDLGIGISSRHGAGWGSSTSKAFRIAVGCESISIGE